MTRPVHGAPQLASLASLLADRTRAAFCLALLDGRAWTAGELARLARVAPSTATGHLARLVASGLLVEQRQGRHRYVRLAGPHVAQLIEDLAAHAPPVPSPAGSLRAAAASTAMARARTCYDHLAGRLGVLVTDAMTRTRLLDQDAGFALTTAGLAWLRTTIGAVELTAGRRPLARACLDWTERRPHLAGAAGAALCRHALDRRWVERIGSQRALRVTHSGRQALRDLLDLDLAAD